MNFVNNELKCWIVKTLTTNDVIGILDHKDERISYYVLSVP